MLVNQVGDRCDQSRGESRGGGIDYLEQGYSGLDLGVESDRLLLVLGREVEFEEGVCRCEQHFPIGL